MTGKRLTLILAFSALVVLTSGNVLDGILKTEEKITEVPEFNIPPVPESPKAEDVANNIPNEPNAEDMGNVIPNVPSAEDKGNEIPEVPNAEDVAKVVIPKIPGGVMPVPPTKEEMDKALPPKDAVIQTVPDVKHSTTAAKSDTSAKPGETASSATTCQLNVCAFLILANGIIHHLW